MCSVSLEVSLLVVDGDQNADGVFIVQSGSTE